MKTAVLFIVAVIVCMALLTSVGAQAQSEKTKSSQDTLPREACQALENYIANIDSAQSQPDSSRRAERYKEAKDKLEPVMKRYGKSAVLEQAYQYATYTDEIVTSDAADARLGDKMDQRLKLRAKLLGMCENYTATR